MKMANFLIRHLAFSSLKSGLILQCRNNNVGGYVHRHFTFGKHNCIFSKQIYFNTLQNYRYLLNVPKLEMCLSLNVHQKLSVTELEPRFNAIADKIVFNSVLDKSRLSWIEQKIQDSRQRKYLKDKINDRDPMNNIPIAIKYLQSSGTDTINTHPEKTEPEIENDVICFPYNIERELDRSTNNDISECESIPESFGELTVETSNRNDFPKEPNWMTDYECYNEVEEQDCTNLSSWGKNYGTPCLKTPSSKIPCGGCGALLHCQDMAIPGYLPSEIFKNQTEETLRALVCQRCHFMRHYDAALNVIVPPDDYPKLMSHVKNEFALIILMVDMLDFPCSIWPGIKDIIGRKQPVIVVGTKVDLLPPDSRGYLERMKNCLIANLEYCGIAPSNIKHVSLISAKTGFGIEELITKLHNIWEYKGDVYLIGCTNVGKSTLFNALLQSDFCKVKAIDLVQRATTSPWPGTTINLLKFPILRPSGWRLYQRTMRLRSVQQKIQAERKLHLQQLRTSHVPAPIGYVGLTFYTKEPVETRDPFTLGHSWKHSTALPGLNPSDGDFARSRWCYDTPGAVHPDQVIHMLTTEELMLMLPKSMVLPRTFRLSPNMTIFIAGLGRLDYLQGPEPIRLTVFASELLPLTVCKTDDADELYRELIGSKLMGVPCGGPTRLSHWPGLKVYPEDITLEGIDRNESCGDVVLSSSGWIAVTPEKGNMCILRGWTPGGRGVYLRKPALLPFAVKLRGKKIRYSPAYHPGKQMYQMV